MSFPSPTLVRFIRPATCAVVSALLMSHLMASATSLGASACAVDGDLRPVWAYPPTEGIEHRTRSVGGSKLPPDLEALHEQIAVGPDIGPDGGFFSAAQLRGFFGIDIDDPDPVISVMITLTDDGDLDALRAAGVTVATRIEELVFGFVPVARLARLGVDPNVATIRSVTITPGPRPIETVQLLQPALPERSLLPPEFGVRGAGVLIGIIDTGIDFTHEDFRDADGLSRIVGIYDVFDDSWTRSEGKLGTEPPFRGPDGAPIGTVYTQFQINEAILGRSTVAQADTDSHGTAVAGVAAGSGRGVKAGADPALARKYRGVAPEAELLIVKAQADGSFPNYALIAGIEWIVAEARQRGKPVVINMSLGGQGTAKDGTTEAEQVIDRLSGAGKPGVAFVIAAGNEGRKSVHAGTRFGPRREGQMDIDGAPVEIVVHQRAQVNAYFMDADNFGLGIQGMSVGGQPGPLVAADGSPQAVFLFNPRDRVLQRSHAPSITPEAMNQFFSTSLMSPEMTPAGEVLIPFMLDPGRYLVWGFAGGPNVPHGTVSFFLPHHDAATFGLGTIKSQMVGSPGNARHAITVGSYDFRGRWQVEGGNWVGYNITGGELSDYSNPGFRRDGVIKPDITAPGQWAISALSSKATVDPRRIADSGAHMVWNGTSAAAPYVSGVVALMLQHNPQLDSEQIRAILAETALEDASTGTVPNPSWGHGKINPAIAISRAQSSVRPGSSTASP